LIGCGDVILTVFGEWGIAIPGSLLPDYKYGRAGHA